MNNEPFEKYQPENFEEIQKPKHIKGYSIASLVLGICSVFFTTCCCCLYYVAIVCGILALIFSLLAKKENGGTFPGMALAGFILSIVGMVFFVLMVVLEIALPGIMSTAEFNQAFRDRTGIDFEEFMQQYENGQFQ